MNIILIQLPQLIQQMFDNKNMMVNCDLQQDRNLAMTTIFRGEISIKEIDEHIFDLQMKDYFYSKNIKTALCKIPSRELKMSSTLIGKIHFRGVKMIFNILFQVITQRFKCLNICRRNFQHCFVEKSLPIWFD